MIREADCGVYVFVNITAGKVYVGSSTQMRIRWNDHLAHLRKGNHENSYLQHAWDRNHGAFEFHVLELVERQRLLEREEFWICELCACVPEKGYNLCSVPSHTVKGIRWSHSSVACKRISKSKMGHLTSPETRAKISASLRGRKLPQHVIEMLRKLHTGRKRSGETKARISSALRGRVISPGWREKISTTLRGRRCPPRTEEHQRKLCESLRQHKRTVEHARNISEGLKLYHKRCRGQHAPC